MASDNKPRFDRQVVESLLNTGGALPESLLDSDPWIGRQLGSYLITGFHAAGGMSRIYRASRCDDQFELDVAIKLIDTPHRSELVHRFHQEQRILATLKHPGIARILDGGVENRQPYLVMEFVDGEPIDSYCDSRHLNLQKRLQLFEQVCEAVHHAHSCLVVHRDIKPSNILVDHLGQVRLLDFGIAKILDPLNEDTGSGQAMMTPRYATPEMVSGRPAQISSDIYQLGLLMYWLLAGFHAYDIETENLANFANVVLNVDARSPSDRVRFATRNDGDATNTVARDRSTRPDRLRKLLKGDLDAIVGKCLRKQPTNRYRTVNALLEDLRALRKHRPIAARPPKAAYLVGRFLRRHRGATSLAFVMGIALITAVASTLLSWRQTLAAQTAALAEAQRAQQVTQLMLDTLSGVDPDIAKGYEFTVADMLDQAARRADDSLVDQPLTNASLRGTLGELYSKLGRLEQAQVQLETALELHEKERGSEAQHTDLLRLLSTVLLARGDTDSAESSAAHAHSSGVSNLGDLDPITLAAKRALIEVWITRGRYQEAHSAALAMSEQLRPEGATDAMLETLAQLARVQTHQTDYSSARDSYEQAIALHRKHRDGPSILLATLLRGLGALSTYQGRDYEAARNSGQEALEITRQLLGEEHVSVAVALSELAGAHSQAGQLEEAESALLEATAIARKRLPSEHDFMASLWNNRAVLKFRQEQYEAASEYYGRSIEIYQQTQGERHPQTLSTRLFRAYGWHLAGREEAESEYRALIPLIEAVRGPDHAHTSHVLIDLGRLLVEQGRSEESLALLERGLAIREKRYGLESQLYADAQLYLGAALSESGNLEDAGPLLDQALDRRSQANGFRSERIQEVQLYRARHLHRKGQTAQATELFQETSAAIIRERPSEHWLHRLASTIDRDFSA